MNGNESISAPLNLYLPLDRDMIRSVSKSGSNDFFKQFLRIFFFIDT